MQATSEYAIITREIKERKVMITKEAYQLIRSHPAFAAIPVEKFDKLAVEIHHREIPKGQIIFFAGDRRDRIFLLQEGYVRIEQFDSSDSFSYMDYIKEGALFPYGGMFISLKENNNRFDLNFAKRILESEEFLNYVKKIGINISGTSLRITSKDIENFYF